MSISKEDIQGVILAGGMGRRMGGIDKGLRNYKNAPLALHAMMRLNEQVGSLCINANRNIGVYEGFGVEVVCDVQPDFAGPLAGMQAALAATTTPFLVTVPCDVPLYPVDLVKKLSEPFEKNVGLMLTVAATQGRQHPVFCMMRSELLPSMEEFLRKGGRKIDAWYANIPHQAVEFSNEAAFHNVNTLEELKELEQKS
jgi:molybdenum cofactor guanylyltransferase